MADWVTIQQGDLDDASTVTSLVGAYNLGNYVHNGLRLRSVDYTAGTFNTTAGKFFVLLDEQYADQQGQYLDYCLLAAHLEPRTGIAFDTSEINYVYAKANLNTNDSPKIEAHPSEQAMEDGILIATIDPSLPSEERITRHNEAPDGAFEALDLNTLNVTQSITYPDGTTREGAPLTRDSVLNNRNNRYDNQASNPQGVVRRARYAQEADSATEANSAIEATNAEYADQAGQLGQYTADDILSVARNTGGEWTLLTDPPIVDSDASSPLDVTFRADTVYDRYKAAIYAESHFSEESDIYARLNGCEGPNYQSLKLQPPGVSDEPVQTFYGDRMFSIADVQAHSDSMTEVEFSLPKPVVKPKYHHPVFATISAANGHGSAYTVNGELTVSYDSLDRIDLFSNNPVTCRIKIYGQNL